MLRAPDLPEGNAEAAASLGAYFTSLAAAPTEPQLGHLSGIYNVGTATEGIVAAVKSAGLSTQVGVICHDLTDAHSAYLSSGELAYVLNQDIHYSVLSSARVLRGLCENIRGALNVVQPRLEILTAENLH